MIVFIGAHLGYPMDRTPLGGGAMVGLRLVRHWAASGLSGLTVLGSGLEAPTSGVEYVRLPEGPGHDLVRLSEFEYARFCRTFEAASTDWLLRRRDRLPPETTAVLVNDVSEGPTVVRLAEAGYPIVSLWHVDVVDYFNKLYLYSLVPPQHLTRLYERCLRLGLGGAVPDLLRIVFEKQRETVAHSRRLIVPSRAMAETLTRCYEGETPGGGLAERIQVVPWGAFADAAPEPSEALLSELRGRYRIGPKTTVLMTLSRISPEKGIHLLIESLRRLEDDGRLEGRDVVLLICGEASFMQGAAYCRRVRAAAKGLRQVRAFFPGYLDPAAKKAHFRLARLFVSPSVHESYGLNIVEAMQAGRAVLASDHYGVHDILDESCGLVVPYPSLAEAPGRLARALESLLAADGRLEAMGRAAAARAAAMPFAKAAETVRRACEEVLSSSARAAR
jgi:glycosyltransferase involved in cell wall biosynthesis